LVVHFFALYCIAGADINGMEFLRACCIYEGPVVYTGYKENITEHWTVIRILKQAMCLILNVV